ncbi:MAG: arsenate reductase ArsC [Burkholderiales bacterium]
MSAKPYQVLFLCTGNSARSIMAEAILNSVGNGRFTAHSAGSQPAGQVNPLAVEMLRKIGYPVEKLRSKSWREFAQPGAPDMDFVFTVCDSAAGEVCPLWPGQPVTAHWGFEDPAAARGSENERRRVFERVYRQLNNRIRIFINLPFEKLDRMSLQRRLKEIGNTSPSAHDV